MSGLDLGVEDRSDVPSPTRGRERFRRSLLAARTLDPRRNSLNLIRLVLATLVIVHHAYPLGGFEGHPSIGNVQLGGWAVFGFFAISGYLITASRLNRPLGSFLVHRVARIFPAFWVCLVVVALVLAPISYLLATGSLNGFLTTGPVTPIDYVLQNATLRIGSYGLGNTLADVPYPLAWNGSLWTLYYEFACYLIIAALCCVAWWRRSAWPTVAGFVLSVVLYANWATISPYVGGNPDLANLLQLLPFFLAGSAFFHLRELLRLHWIGAAVSVVGLALAQWLAPGWGLQAAGVLLAYVLFWVGDVLPSGRWFQRNDLSYGTYIYAFPLAQLLSQVGVNSWGLTPYILITVVLTAVLAWLSWTWVERPIMRRVRSS